MGIDSECEQCYDSVGRRSALPAFERLQSALLTGIFPFLWCA